MGDWDRMFGGAVSAETVIDSINRSWEAEQRESDDPEDDHDNQEKWWAPTTLLGRTESKHLFEFVCYAEMKAWDERNPKIAYVRKRFGNGYLMKVTDVPEGWQYK